MNEISISYENKIFINDCRDYQISWRFSGDDFFIHLLRCVLDGQICESWNKLQFNLISNLIN